MKRSARCRSCKKDSTMRQRSMLKGYSMYLHIENNFQVVAGGYKWICTLAIALYSFEFWWFTISCLAIRWNWAYFGAFKGRSALKLPSSYPPFMPLSSFTLLFQFAGPNLGSRIQGDSAPPFPPSTMVPWNTGSFSDYAFADQKVMFYLFSFLDLGICLYLSRKRLCPRDPGPSVMDARTRRVDFSTCRCGNEACSGAIFIDPLDNHSIKHSMSSLDRRMFE